MNVNKCFVLGNLTRDPDLKAMPDGTPIALFGLATNHRARRDGKVVEVPDFHSIVVYGKQAEDCAKYLRKGGLAHIEGRIQTRTFEKDGVKHNRTEIIADRVQFGPRPGAVNGPGKDVAAEDDADQRPPSERAAQSAIAGQASDDWEPDPDLIPF